MPKVYLSDEICAAARDKLVELLEATDEKGLLVQHRAADVLLRACQTQERYILRPQNASDFEQHRTRPGSAAKALEDMTPEELLELQHEMLKGEYPGKPV